MLLRFLHKVPTFRLLLPFLAGIMLVSDHLKLAWSLLFFGFWGLLLFASLEKRMPTAWSVRWIPGVCMVCLWVSLGAFASGLEHRKTALPQIQAVKQSALVCLESVPLEKPRSFQCQVRILNAVNKDWEGKRLQLYLAKDKRSGALEAGDKLLLGFKPKNPEPPVKPGDFDYAAWLRNKGICATAYVPARSWKLHSRASVLNVRAAAERMRAVILSRFRESGISGEEFSMVSALTLGSVHLLTRETRQVFSVSGVSHILSVSGLHVAIVFAVLEFLLSFFNRIDRLRLLKQLLIVAVLWCYAFMTGLSPSVIRSAFMLSMVCMGRCLNRKPQTVNTVLFSAFILLVWSPSFLYDLGFELSYCAVLAIVLVHPRMTALWKPTSRLVGYLWEMTCLSVVAQLATAPLTLYTFHQFPNYFLLNNLVAVPASGLIIYLACAFLLLGSVPYLGAVLTWCLNGSLHWFQWFVRIMSGMPFALTENVQLPKVEVYLLYLLMGSFFVWFFLKRRKWLFAVLGCLLCLQGLALSQHFKLQKKSDLCEMYVNSYLCEKRNPC